MFENDLNYDKTVNTKKLVFKGQKSKQLFSYFMMLLIIGIGAYFCYNIFTTQLQSNPTMMDYFIAIFFPLLISLSIIALCVNILRKDKLKEIEINININKAKQKLLQAGINLGWRADEVTENHILFVTKYSLLRDGQHVTLIYFPDNRVYFNSLAYPHNYDGPSRFMDNFQQLTEEYFKIEKEKD